MSIIEPGESNIIKSKPPSGIAEQNVCCNVSNGHEHENPDQKVCEAPTNRDQLFASIVNNSFGAGDAKSIVGINASHSPSEVIMINASSRQKKTTSLLSKLRSHDFHTQYQDGKELSSGFSSFPSLSSSSVSSQISFPTAPISDDGGNAVSSASALHFLASVSTLSSELLSPNSLNTARAGDLTEATDRKSSLDAVTGHNDIHILSQAKVHYAERSSVDDEDSEVLTSAIGITTTVRGPPSIIDHEHNDTRKCAFDETNINISVAARSSIVLPAESPLVEDRDGVDKDGVDGNGSSPRTTLSRRKRLKYFHLPGAHPNSPPMIAPKGVYTTINGAFRVQLNQRKGCAHKFSRNTAQFDEAVWLYEIAILISDRPCTISQLLQTGNYSSILSMQFLTTPEEYYEELGRRVVVYSKDGKLRDQEGPLAIKLFDELVLCTSAELSSVVSGPSPTVVVGDPIKGSSSTATRTKSLVSEGLSCVDVFAVDSSPQSQLQSHAAAVDRCNALVAAGLALSAPGSPRDSYATTVTTSSGSGIFGGVSSAHVLGSSSSSSVNLCDSSSSLAAGILHRGAAAAYHSNSSQRVDPDAPVNAPRGVTSGGISLVQSQHSPSYHYSPLAFDSSQLTGMQQFAQMQQRQAAANLAVVGGAGVGAFGANNHNGSVLVLPTSSGGSGFSSWVSSPAASVDASPSIGDAAWFLSSQQQQQSLGQPAISISPLVASLMAQKLHLSPAAMSPALIDASFSPRPSVNAAGLAVVAGRPALPLQQPSSSSSSSSSEPVQPSSRPMNSFLPQHPEQRHEPL